MMLISGIRYEMGRSSTIHVKVSIRWYLGKSVQIVNTWVRATQKCFGFVRHGDSSEDIEAQLSKIEDFGEEVYGSENFDYETLTPDMGGLKQEQLSKIVRNEWRWRRKRYLLPVERKRTSVRKETNAVSGMSVTIVHKNQNTMPPHLSSHPTREVEVCRRKVSKATITIVQNADSRADTIFKGTCTRSPCEYWHPPECQLDKTETGCKAGDKCLFPHHKVMNNQIKCLKRATSQKEEKAMTRKLWLLWKVYHNWVASRKTRMRWFPKEANSPRETRCEKSWDRFEKYGSLSRRYVKQVSGKRKDHCLEIYKSNILISEVPELRNLRTTRPMKRLEDNSDVPEARHGTLPKTHTSSKRKTKLHSTRPRKNGYSRLRQQKSWRKESL